MRGMQARREPNKFQGNKGSLTVEQPGSPSVFRKDCDVLSRQSASQSTVIPACVRDLTTALSNIPSLMTKSTWLAEMLRAARAALTLL